MKEENDGGLIARTRFKEEEDGQLGSLKEERLKRSWRGEDVERARAATSEAHFYSRFSILLKSHLIQ